MPAQEMFQRISRCAGLLALSLLTCQLNLASAAERDEPQLSYLQGLVGAAAFENDNLTFVATGLDDPTVPAGNDLSSMPCVGIAGQFALTGTGNQVGLDTSLLFGWRSASTSITAGNNQARVEIDSEFWLVDVAVGLYAQAMLGDRWRLYGAAGPLLLFGEYSDDAAERDLSVEPQQVTRSSNSQSEFGVGGYARVGLEYRMTRSAFVGLAVRGISTNLEFDRTVNDSGLTGLQGFVTFTRAY